MIRIPTGLFGLIGLLLTVLPTAAPASVNKPTAEERGACMGDAFSLCIAAIPNKARIASCLLRKCLNSARAAAHSSTGRPAANRLGNLSWAGIVESPRPG
jgi:hypothetical protein